MATRRTRKISTSSEHDQVSAKDDILKTSNWRRRHHHRLHVARYAQLAADSGGSSLESIRVPTGPQSRSRSVRNTDSSGSLWQQVSDTSDWITPSRPSRSPSPPGSGFPLAEKLAHVSYRDGAGLIQSIEPYRFKLGGENGEVFKSQKLSTIRFTVPRHNTEHREVQHEGVLLGILERNHGIEDLTPSGDSSDLLESSNVLTTPRSTQSPNSEETRFQGLLARLTRKPRKFGVNINSSTYQDSAADSRVATPKTNQPKAGSTATTTNTARQVPARASPAQTQKFLVTNNRAHRSLAQGRDTVLNPAAAEFTVHSFSRLPPRQPLSNIFAAAPGLGPVLQEPPLSYRPNITGLSYITSPQSRVSQPLVELNGLGTEGRFNTMHSMVPTLMSDDPNSRGCNYNTVSGTASTAILTLGTTECVSMPAGGYVTIQDPVIAPNVATFPNHSNGAPPALLAPFTHGRAATGYASTTAVSNHPGNPSTAGLIAQGWKPPIVEAGIPPQTCAPAGLPNNQAPTGQPQFPIVKRPRGNNTWEQMEYEKYLEWRKANEPGFHISCKIRQAQRATRQAPGSQIFTPAPTQ